MSSNDTMTAGERISKGFKTLDSTQRMILRKEIDAAIDEAQNPVAVSLAFCANAAIQAHAQSDGDNNVTEKFRHIAKAVIESLIKQGVRVYVE